jgi:hypothetical protein
MPVSLFYRKETPQPHQKNNSRQEKLNKHNQPSKSIGVSNLWCHILFLSLNSLKEK